MKLLKLLALPIFIAITLISNTFSQSTGSISGQISDGLGGTVAGGLVTISDEKGAERKTITNKDGVFAFKSVAFGKYTLKVIAPKFSLYENKEVEVRTSEKFEITIVLTIAPIETEVEVTNEKQVSTDSNSNISAIVLSEEDLENLPDDPEELEAYLQAMAGGAVGIDGGAFYIDGISGGKLPPKSSIKEIRINRSPFSAEYERVGFGGIEVITKPGTSQFRGQSNFNFNDARLNSRNPFALIRPPSQSQNYGFNFSGPIQNKVSSFFVDFNQNVQDTSRVVNASVVNSSFNIVPFQAEITTPSKSFYLGGRVDYQLNKNNTLMARYGFSSSKSENQGVSDFSLPTRAFDSRSRSHDFRLTESMTINATTVNETLFSYNFSQREQEGDNSTPTINVSGAFTGGGSQIGFNFNHTKRWELQNNTTTIFGKNAQHIVKFGGKIRQVSIEDRSESNFGGSFTFSGIRDAVTGALLFSSIEQYRQKVSGNLDPRFNPTQYSISSGNPLSNITQTELGFFAVDEWRISGNLTINYGLRYENQTNIHDFTDFAPRFGFAYAPDAKEGKAAKTVLRGGFGIFYSRLNENFFLQAKRLDGNRQTQYIVSNPDTLGIPVFTLNGVTNVPTIAQISAFAKQSTVTVRRISEELASPLAYQLALSVDRQLPFKTKLAVTYIFSDNLSQTGIRNINAPFCPPLQPCSSTSPRPNPTEGNIYLYESIGKTDQQQFIVNFNSNLVKGLSLNGNYRFGFAKNNIDGSGSFPFYSYDLDSDYGASSSDVRHSFSFQGSYQMPWKIRVNSSLNLSSGRPFNITTGADSNRDSIFNDRPTYSQLFATCQKLQLNDSFCDINRIENPSTTIIPRNYGRGPGFFNLNLGLNRSFTFKRAKEKSRAYNLVIGVQASNLLNHTNRNAPISNLSSNRFGQTFSTMTFNSGGANRRIELQARFNF